MVSRPWNGQQTMGWSADHGMVCWNGLLKMFADRVTGTEREERAGEGGGGPAAGGRGVVAEAELLRVGDRLCVCVCARAREKKGWKREKRTD